ncbi:hypothetical protein [Patiriisocius marinus]|nr:hypothetical protein [Patiriisocius marinus]
MYGGIIVLLIAISPYFFYVYESFPSDSQTWETSFFTITTSYANIQVYFWFLTGKIVPIYLLLLWFFTCKNWWHWIIMAPLSIYIFQLWSLVNQSSSLDEVEIYYMFPVMLVLVPCVYLIRAKIFNNIQGNDFEKFEEDLGKKRSVWDQITDLFR